MIKDINVFLQIEIYIDNFRTDRYFKNKRVSVFAKVNPKDYEEITAIQRSEHEKNFIRTSSLSG